MNAETYVVYPFPCVSNKFAFSISIPQHGPTSDSPTISQTASRQRKSFAGGHCGPLLNLCLGKSGAAGQTEALKTLHQISPLCLSISSLPESDTSRERLSAPSRAPGSKSRNLELPSPCRALSTSPVKEHLWSATKAQWFVRC